MTEQLREIGGRLAALRDIEGIGKEVFASKCGITAAQLEEYFAGKRREFDLPLRFNGTEFQRRVWSALMTIPYGETRSYGAVAKLCGNAKASRAVGMANNRNPVVIICPCHRVIGSDGSLVGFGGGITVKKWLLDHENKKLFALWKKLK